MNISDTFSDGDLVAPMFECECPVYHIEPDKPCPICGGEVQNEPGRNDWIFLLPCFGLMLLCLWAALFLKR